MNSAQIVSKFISLVQEKKIEEAWQFGSELSKVPVTDDIIRVTDLAMESRRSSFKVIASFDHYRKPSSNEQIIIYGNYPNAANNLIFSNPCYRHVKYFASMKHDVTESHSAWKDVDQIYILNLDSRPDRYWELLRELARISAPLDRLTRFSALTMKVSGNPYINGTVGCAASHLAIVEQAVSKNYSCILILEDDFSFSDPIPQAIEDIGSFFKLKLNFDVCLLATSKYFHMEPVNDLLALSFQECTTCAGFFLSANGMRKLLPIWRRSLDQLIATGECNTYACDRSWKTMQADRQFYLFRRKLGFQRPNFSTTSQQIVFPLD